MKFIKTLFPVLLGIALFGVGLFAITSVLRRNKEQKTIELINKMVHQNELDYSLDEKEKRIIARGCNRCAPDKIAELEKLVSLWWEADQESPLRLIEMVPDLPELRETLKYIDDNPDLQYYVALKETIVGHDSYWSVLFDHCFLRMTTDGSGEKKLYYKVE